MLDAQAEADMRCMGLTEEQIAQERRGRAAAAATDGDEHLALPRHLWPVVRLFAALRSQWRVAIGQGGLLYLGLDYAAVRHAMWLLELPAKGRARLFEHLRVMESEARALLNATVGA